jgi:hypothetical protein
MAALALTWGGATPAVADDIEDASTRGFSVAVDDAQTTQLEATIAWTAKAVENHIYVCDGTGTPLPCPEFAVHEVPGATTPTPKSTTFSLTGLADNHLYTVWVRAIYPMPLGAAPLTYDASVNLTTKPWRVAETLVVPDWTSAHFSIVDDPGGTDPYMVYAARSWEHTPGEYWVAALIPAGTKEYQLPDLTPNTRYWFYLQRGNSRSQDFEVRTWVPGYSTPGAGLSGGTLKANVSSIWNVAGTQQLWVHPHGAPEAIYVGSKPNKTSGQSAGAITVDLNLKDGQTANVFQTMDVNGLIMKSPAAQVRRTKDLAITSVTFTQKIVQHEHYWVKRDTGERLGPAWSLPAKGECLYDGESHSRDSYCWERVADVPADVTGDITFTWTYPKKYLKGSTAAIRTPSCSAKYPATSCTAKEAVTYHLDPATGAPAGTGTKWNTQLWVIENPKKGFSEGLHRSPDYTITCIQGSCTVKLAKKKGKDPKDKALPAPSKIKASAPTLTGATLNWKNGKDAANTQIAIAYNKVGPWLYVGSTKKTTFTLTGLKPATKYFVKVFHTKGKDDSSKSVTTSFTTASSTPLNPSVVNVTASGFRVNWQSAWAGNKGFGTSKTAVYLAFNPGGPWVYWGQAAALTYFEAGGLAPATTYWIRLQDMSGPPTQPRYSTAAKLETTTLPS